MFEDTAIPIQNQTLISLDISQHFELCGNYVDVFFASSTNGVLFYNKMCVEPFLGGIDRQKKFKILEGTNFFVVSKVLSDKLTYGLNTHSIYTNAYSICTNFVNFLNSDDLQNISSNHIKNVFYQKGVNDAIYMSYREDFINDLSGVQFFYPPKSSFYIMEAGFNGVAQETVWAFIPYRTRSKRLNCYIAVFFNNYWHLISPYDPVLEEFLEKAKEKVQNSISNDN